MPYLVVPTHPCQRAASSHHNHPQNDQQECFEVSEANMAAIVEAFWDDYEAIDYELDQFRATEQWGAAALAQELLDRMISEANQLYHNEPLTFKLHWPKAAVEPDGGWDHDEEDFRAQSYFP